MGELDMGWGTPLFNSVAISILGVGLSFLTARYWFLRNEAVAKATSLASEHAILEHRVREMEKQLSVVGAAVVPITTAFQALLIKELTHYHTPVMDALMEKVEDKTITPEEEQLLGQALEERTRDMGDEISDSEREAAMLLPIIMRRAKAETALIEHESTLAVVSVPTVEKGPETGPPDIQ